MDKITTPAEELEAAAHAMWHHEGKRAGTPAVAAKRTREAFADEDESTRAKWLGLAGAALAARIAAPVAVVKPLEWRFSEQDYYDRTTGERKVIGEHWDAETKIASDRYSIMRLTDKRIKNPVEGYIAEIGNKKVTHPTIEAAKAAAQADYEARLLSGITIQPAAQVQAEAVAGAVARALEEITNGLILVAPDSVPAREALASYRGQFATLLRLIIPADATAALSRRDADVREKALREAAQKIALHLELMAALNLVWPVTTSDKVIAILALIDKEPAHD